MTHLKVSPNISNTTPMGVHCESKTSEAWDHTGDNSKSKACISPLLNGAARSPKFISSISTNSSKYTKELHSARLFKVKPAFSYPISKQPSSEDTRTPAISDVDRILPINQSSRILPRTLGSSTVDHLFFTGNSDLNKSSNIKIKTPHNGNDKKIEDMSSVQKGTMSNLTVPSGFASGGFRRHLNNLKYQENSSGSSMDGGNSPISPESNTMNSKSKFAVSSKFSSAVNGSK